MIGNTEGTIASTISQSNSTTKSKISSVKPEKGSRVSDGKSSGTTIHTGADTENDLQRQRLKDEKSRKMTLHSSEDTSITTKPKTKPMKTFKQKPLTKPMTKTSVKPNLKISQKTSPTKGSPIKPKI